MRAKRACIKQEFVEICKGDFLKALILDKIMEWIEQMRMVGEYVAEENARRQKALLPPIEINADGWIYRTEKALQSELMLNLSERTIRRAIDGLVELGFIVKRINPERPWERVSQFRPNFPAILKALESAGWRGEIKVDNLKIQKANRPALSQTNKKTSADKKTPSPDAQKLADFAFKEIQSYHKISFTPSQIIQAQKMFDNFLNVKKIPADKIKDAIHWVMTDTIPRDGFCWADQLQSPLKLKRRDKDGVLYIEKFINLMEKDADYQGVLQDSKRASLEIPNSKVSSRFKQRLKRASI